MMQLTYLKKEEIKGPNPFRIEKKITSKFFELARARKIKFELTSTFNMYSGTVITNIYSATYKLYTILYTLRFDNYKKNVLGQAYDLYDRDILISRYHRLYSRNTTLGDVDKNLLSILRLINPFIYNNIYEDRQNLIDNFLNN